MEALTAVAKADFASLLICGIERRQGRGGVAAAVTRGAGGFGGRQEQDWSGADLPLDVAGQSTLDDLGDASLRHRQISAHRPLPLRPALLHASHFKIFRTMASVTLNPVVG